MKVIVAGDYVPCGRLSPIVRRRDFSFLSDIKDIIIDSDYSIVNLECPVSDESDRPISKVGPHLRCDRAGIEALHWAGIKCVTLANNHFYDYGEGGVKKTLETCNSFGLDTVGGGYRLNDASKVLIKEFQGESLAIINCCEHEFSLSSERKGGANPLDPVRVYYDIQSSKKNADYVIVIVHGGHEHFQLPSLRMVELYRFFVDAGADAVLNHHQHCFSGYEIYKSKPIYYGLGNFCFDSFGIKTGPLWYSGFMVKLSFDSGNVSSSIQPYFQCADDELKVKITDDESLLKCIEGLNQIISDKATLIKYIDEYYAHSIHDLRVVLSPLNNRLLRAAQYRRLLPVFLSNKYLLRLEDFFMCESHRDKMEYFFNKRRG